MNPTQVEGEEEFGEGCGNGVELDGSLRLGDDPSLLGEETDYSASIVLGSDLPMTESNRHRRPEAGFAMSMPLLRST